MLKSPSMEKISITDWSMHGDYMLYAGMVDKVRDERLGSIILQVDHRNLTAIGQKKPLDRFCELLEQKSIIFSRK